MDSRGFLSTFININKGLLTNRMSVVISSLQLGQLPIHDE
jgi:hypothetical protein